MQENSLAVSPIETLLPARNSLVVAKITSVSPEGAVYVSVDGFADAVQVSSAVGLSPETTEADVSGKEVLVLVRQTNPFSGTIVGFLRESLWERTVAEGRLPAENLGIRADGRKVVVSAEEEITLVCGKSSLLLRQDGTIVLKGIRLVSRASESNKIRGASVHIN